MLWAVYCKDKANTAETRKTFMDVHRTYLAGQEPKIFFSGPLQSDDATSAHGSLYVLNVKDRAAAQAFVDNEPFYKAGVFESVLISRMRKGRYNAALVDVP